MQFESYHRLKVVSMVFLVMLLSGACNQGANKSKEIAKNKVKPNILWITIEDTSPQFIGCYRNKDAHTPVIDQLASEGVRFTNAFSTGTVCSPSRSAIITGVKTYETGTGNQRSNYPVPEFIKGFPYYLQQHGYYTTNNSKTDYNLANAKTFISEAWDESSGKAGWWSRKAGQPFFAVFNFMDSHQSRTMTEPYSWYQKNVLDHLNESDWIGDQEFEMPPFYRDSPEMRKQFARVYNSIKLTDNNIGKLLTRLEQDGLKDSTIIFFYADHGEGVPRGKANGINLGYRVPFVLWFPEMYKELSPWGTGGVVTDELIDFTDLAPTMINLVGGDLPDYLKGRILLGENRSPKAEHLVLSTDRVDNGIDKVRSVTNGKYIYSRVFMPYMPEVRYINYFEIGEITQHMRHDLASGNLNPFQESLFHGRLPESLYDIENDSWETKNLANDPTYKELLNDFREQLKNEIIGSRDVLLLPEYEIGKISENSTPYEFRLDEEAYPISEIYEAASLSGFRGEETAQKQVLLLKYENPFIRYWAIVGLRSQEKVLKEVYKEPIIEALNDSYPPVAVTAAAIAYRSFGNKKAEALLNEFIQQENQDLALMAINYLLYTDNIEPFIESVRNVQNRKTSMYRVTSACADFFMRNKISP